MATVPVIRTFVAGEVVLASYFNTNINGPLSYLLSPPIVQGRQTVAQTLTNNTDAAITMDTEDVDSSGMHSTSSNTSRFTAVYPGWYQCAGSVGFSANATGRRTCQWRVTGGGSMNGSGASFPTTAANVAKVVSPTLLIFLNVGDYAELFGRQESGGGLNTAVSTADQSMASLAWNSN